MAVNDRSPRPSAWLRPARLARPLTLAALAASIAFGGGLAAVSNTITTFAAPEAADSTVQDARFFPQTGFRIDDDAVWAYFQSRGGIATFGYPVSRTFTFLGFQTQIFQRHLIQIGGSGTGSVSPMNLLDPDLMPVSTVNFSVFPAHDPKLAASAPSPSTPHYGEAVVAHLTANVPDTWNGQKVNFFQSYLNAAPADAGALRPLVALEIWGFPTSQPAYDPHNRNFIYQRFQRGILHYDATTGATQGILLADTFKSVLTGRNLPSDVAAQMATSPYYLAYDANQPTGVVARRAFDLATTKLTNAFTQQQPVATPSSDTIPVTNAGTTPETPPPAPTPPPYKEGFAYGMQAHLYYQDVPGAMNLVQNAGFGWIKQQVRWSDVEVRPGVYDWTPLDQIVNGAAQDGLKVLFSVVSSPPWTRSDHTTDGPPDDYTQFATFIQQMATRYKGKVHAYEIWNEQNFSREWGGGRINAGEYVELLKTVYPVLKAADPNATVISGALTPTGFNDPAVAIDDVAYLQQMYAYQNGIIKTVSDAIGAHTGGFNNPPDDWTDKKTVPSTTFKDHPSFYFRRIEQLHDVMVTNGDTNKKLWITEAGWSTANLAPGYEYGNDNTETDQANYLVRAYQLAHKYGWVDGMFIWNLNFEEIVPPTDEKFPFGIVRPDGSPRPAYTALQTMPKLP